MKPPVNILVMRAIRRLASATITGADNTYVLYFLVEAHAYLSEAIRLTKMDMEDENK